MSKELEPVYLASCPFCEYRELFSSALTMLAIYGTHLLDHQGKVGKERRQGREGAARQMDGVARHLQRAQYGSIQLRAGRESVEFTCDC